MGQVSLDAATSSALQAFFSAGVVVVCVLSGGLVGLRIKLFRAILFFGGIVASAVGAFCGCDLASHLLEGAGIPAGWSLVAGYGACLLGSFIFLALFVRIYVPSRAMNYFASLDNFGGIAVGGLAGLLLVSVVRVGFAMAPIPASARPSPEQLHADVTPQVLHMMAKILFTDPEDEARWLWGVRDPDEGDLELGLSACSEPYVDLNGNRRRDGSEPFLDKDGDGEFTPSFVVLGPEDEDAIVVGVMDRYWLGDWRLVTVMVTNVGGP